jgi:ABC-type amino acid transport substrate-binding protein
MERNIGLIVRDRRFWAGCLLLLILSGVVFFIVSPDSSRTLLFFREDPTWQQMQQRGTWRVGMDPSFPPFESLDEAGKPIGYDVELAEQLAGRWGLEVEIVAIGFDSLIDALQAGKIDSIVSALPHDPRLTKDIAYSEPYFEAGVRLAVVNGSDSETVDDLEGKTIAVEWGSAGDMVGRRIMRDGIDAELAKYPTPQEAVDGLLTDDDVDALLIDNVTLRGAQGAGAALHAVGPALESDPYVVAMPLRSGELQKHVAEALAALQEEGTMDKLESNWFGDQ